MRKLSEGVFELPRGHSSLAGSRPSQIVSARESYPSSHDALKDTPSPVTRIDTVNEESRVFRETGERERPATLLPSHEDVLNGQVKKANSLPNVERGE